MKQNLARIFIATALTAALATPAFSQSGQASDPYQAFAQQKSKAKKVAKKRPAQRTVTRHQQTAAMPCAAWSWAGCLGWDPDPNVRSMIRMDANLYDD